MAVRIVPSKTFKTPITFTEVGEDGNPDRQSFVAEFKRLTQAEISDGFMKLPNDREMALAVLVGWDMKDTDGNAVDFSKVTEILTTKPGLAGVISLEFMEKVGAARVKN